MGNFINIGNAAFAMTRNSEYVDKSGVISLVNATINTENMCSCITRCRRFGKSMVAKMLCAYYDQSCDSRELFKGLEIESDPSFEQHLNKYPVIFLDISDFVTRYRENDIVRKIDEKLREDILQDYPGQIQKEDDDLMECLTRIIRVENKKFIFIIDEWDGILREFEGQKAVIDEYVNWLRRLFKGGQTAKVFAGVYMTGILPIKKYDTQSALNNFIEYSMVAPMGMSTYFGFTKDEVMALAARHHMDYGELEKWYDGYLIGPSSQMFNPNSVMKALQARFCQSYWSSTGAFDSVSDYISMNFEGLRDDIIFMLGGGRCMVDTTGFENDLSIITTKDDVLTVLIHLGYLTYDRVERECFIPNMEVAGELVNAIRRLKWKEVMDALNKSKRLLQDTIAGRSDLVASGIDAVHTEQTSILSYNDENSLACVISLAYYYARNDYIIEREEPTGYGYADMVFTPRPNVDKPALIIELKQGKSAEEAIRQIHERKYEEKVRKRTPHILLIGINYDPESKRHTCIIEKGESPLE